MANAEQKEHWNGSAGEQWAGNDDTMAELLAPFSDALMEHATVRGASAALDIGCGGGSPTLALPWRRPGAEPVSFPTVAFAGDESALTSLLAVTDAYPLRGRASWPF